MSEPGALLRYASPAGRWAVLATVLGSSLASLDATVVNVALPRIGQDLHAGVAALQWTVNAYALTLSALMLLAGSLGDRYGRRRMFVIGVAWFVIASLLCAIAPTAGALVAARAFQGCGGALLIPESLAILEAAFHPDDRAAAIGAWSGLGGIAILIGPFLGGWLVQSFSWRWIFLLNVPLGTFVVLVALRHLPETRGRRAHAGVDLPGTLLAAAGLAGITYALTVVADLGARSPVVLASGLGGLVAFAALAAVEARSPHPMLPKALVRSRVFEAVNVVTLVLYGALGGSVFLLPITLQRGAGFSPLESGLALAPITLIMLVLSPRAGRLSGRIGPRVPMTVGPIVAGVGLLLLSRIGVHTRYVEDVLPGIIVLGLGLACTVAPLTATALAAAGDEQAGVGSAINNAVSRVAGLITVAVLPGLVGIGADAFRHPAGLVAGFHAAMRITGGMCVAAGLLAAVTIPGPMTTAHDAAPCRHGGVDAVPLRRACAAGPEAARATR